MYNLFSQDVLRVRGSLKFEIAGVDQTVARFIRYCGRGTTPLVIPCSLLHASEFAGDVDAAALLSIKHIASIECLVSQFESRVISFSVPSLLFLSLELLLGKLG